MVYIQVCLLGLETVETWKLLCQSYDVCNKQKGVGRQCLPNDHSCLASSKHCQEGQLWFGCLKKYGMRFLPHHLGCHSETSGWHWNRDSHLQDGHMHTTYVHTSHVIDTRHNTTTYQAPHTVSPGDESVFHALTH